MVGMYDESRWGAPILGGLVTDLPTKSYMTSLRTDSLPGVGFRRSGSIAFGQKRSVTLTPKSGLKR